MSKEITDPAVQGCIMFYSLDCYNKFNRLTQEQCQAAVDAASESAQHFPSFMRNKKGEFCEYEIPNFGKRSSPYCAALMSAWLVWHQKVLRDNPLPSSSLLEYSVQGLQLFDRAGLSDYWKERSQKHDDSKRVGA